MLLDPLIDYALPPRCPGCGVIVAGPHRFCLDCWKGLDFPGGPACEICGAGVQPGIETCGPCLADPPAYHGATAAVAYGPVASAIALRLKYGRRPGLARTMARLMARLVPDDPDLLIAPVPLHRWRIWRRGYNQSAVIARALGRLTGRAVDVDLVVRTRATPPLRNMSPGQRRRTVAGAFVARPRAEGRRVLLIDDVFTTGATADACARALRQAGAVSVSLLCWARVMPPDD